ncbi:MAG: phosphoglucosamine mutase [Gammaproteobacteria bacterium]|nr:phosphoglucosamine mutase [Gammaproteobacteria bacterium]MYK47390.1 phosphoglucosamine mutase [Gammaproteobacteria bacterium]
MDRDYFGTDGIRGRVGDPPITPDFCVHLGWAVGKVLASSGSPLVVIGKDTRISGYMIESALEAGLASAGVDVNLFGPIPTPAIAYLTRTLRADAGIVISASHNPFEDNGIKFFDADGNKLPDEMEVAIEAQLRQPVVSVGAQELGRAYRVDDARGRYIEFCKGTIDRGVHFRGLKLVIDCAHGATYAVAPGVFSELGADVTVIGADPDGTNINHECGSTHPDALARKVVEIGADAGIAFDGDGDRVIMVDANGDIVDGDEMLYVIAKTGLPKGRLTGGVVGTVMSNLGLERALETCGIPFERAAVGDRYVLELMRARGWQLGGETSGHLVCLALTTTGDGIVSALQVLVAMVESERSLAELRNGMQKLPQAMVNVQIDDPGGIAANPLVDDAIRGIEAHLNGRGRVVIRPSGTEPVVRVMVEGEDADEVNEQAASLAAVVEQANGG